MSAKGERPMFARNIRLFADYEYAASNPAEHGPI
jgi:hypothetical protein